MKHFLSMLKPNALHQRMLDTSKWRKDETFYKKDFDQFVRETASQAEKPQAEHSF